MLSHAYGANAGPLETRSRPFSSKVTMIHTFSFVLRRLSHLPFPPGSH